MPTLELLCTLCWEDARRGAFPLPRPSSQWGDHLWVPQDWNVDGHSLFCSNLCLMPFELALPTVYWSSSSTVGAHLVGDLSTCANILLHLDAGSSCWTRSSREHPELPVSPSLAQWSLHPASGTHWPTPHTTHQVQQLHFKCPSSNPFFQTFSLYVPNTFVYRFLFL